jgi:hypothetical protein
VGVFTLISSPRSSAQQTIYYDSLTNTTSTGLDSTSPNPDTTGDTWIADSGITETSTGTTLGADGDSAYLAFTPTLGDDYSLTLDVNNSTGTNGVGVGFTQNDDTTNQFYGDGQQFWMELSSPDGMGKTTVNYYNPGNNVAASGTYTDSETLTVNLQTTTDGSDWTETYYVDSVEVGTLQSVPANVTYVGFGDFNGSSADSGDVTGFDLVDESIAATPEPSTWAMPSGGLACWFSSVAAKTCARKASGFPGGFVRLLRSRTRRRISSDARDGDDAVVNRPGNANGKPFQASYHHWIKFSETAVVAARP